jgi:hypothetical protein
VPEGYTAGVRDHTRKALRRAAWGAGAVLCIAGVPAVIVALVHLLYGVPLSAYRPLINDEVTYWHQASTFRYAGFGGGYYTLDETTNASGLTPFGLHGPGFPVLYGLAGKVAGWTRHSVVILNLAALCLAGAVWVALSRVGGARLLLSGVFLVTCWHVLYWALTGMQEPLHHAGAIAMAALFASVLGQPSRSWVTVSGWLVLAGLSFIRPSWAILLPLWALATSHGASTPRLLVALGASVVCAAVILAAYSRTVAPFSSGFFFLRALSFSLAAGDILGNVMANVRRLSTPDQFEAIEILQRYQYLAFLIVTMVALAVSRRRHFLIAGAAMLTAAAAMFVMYEFASFAEHRVLSAFLLFGALLCLAAPGKIGPVLVAGLIFSNLASARVSLTNIEAGRRDQFRYDDSGVRQMQQAISGKVVYRPGASRWCNTLLTSQFPPDLIAIPPGIGLSVVQRPERVGRAPKSRYLLLDQPMRAAFANPLDVEEIATLPYGVLYFNRSVACESSHARTE